MRTRSTLRLSGRLTFSVVAFLTGKRWYKLTAFDAVVALLPCPVCSHPQFLPSEVGQGQSPYVGAAEVWVHRCFYDYTQVLSSCFASGLPHPHNKDIYTLTTTQIKSVKSFR